MITTDKISTFSGYVVLRIHEDKLKEYKDIIVPNKWVIVVYYTHNKGQCLKLPEISDIFVGNNKDKLCKLKSRINYYPSGLNEILDERKHPYISVMYNYHQFKIDEILLTLDDITKFDPAYIPDTLSNEIIKGRKTIEKLLDIDIDSFNSITTDKDNIISESIVTATNDAAVPNGTWSGGYTTVSSTPLITTSYDNTCIKVDNIPSLEEVDELRNKVKELESKLEKHEASESKDTQFNENGEVVW